MATTEPRNAWQKLKLRLRGDVAIRQEKYDHRDVLKASIGSPIKVSALSPTMTRQIITNADKRILIWLDEVNAAAKESINIKSQMYDAPCQIAQIAESCQSEGTGPSSFEAHGVGEFSEAIIRPLRVKTRKSSSPPISPVMTQCEPTLSPLDTKSTRRACTSHFLPRNRVSSLTTAAQGRQTMPPLSHSLPCSAPTGELRTSIAKASLASSISRTNALKFPTPPRRSPQSWRNLLKVPDESADTLIDETSQDTVPLIAGRLADRRVSKAPRWSRPLSRLFHAATSEPKSMATQRYSVSSSFYSSDSQTLASFGAHDPLSARHASVISTDIALKQAEVVKQRERLTLLPKTIELSAERMGITDVEAEISETLNELCTAQYQAALNELRHSTSRKRFAS
ncbi:uncharacterized protein L969DRAFT_17455 [Mixia osmundae IAM 14324]|uniref:uncharacterized protein n=1 Tax=Mixia osmundae (strain CBS 9802 / IAM 14324 / JCM 22182 / KY 12970) TaxID=764103 RepID=UPI0004A554D8|nr:uncharacterized protein L969DRAFT_17455 [Mixia osmundae IAM 14324]KEI39534.1 hypothetical protein L969DRAFT_17455 [Mixia osmundae IAM 14324]